MRVTFEFYSLLPSYSHTRYSLLPSYSRLISRNSLSVLYAQLHRKFNMSLFPVSCSYLKWRFLVSWALLFLLLLLMQAKLNPPSLALGLRHSVFCLRCRLRLFLFGLTTCHLLLWVTILCLAYLSNVW